MLLDLPISSKLYFFFLLGVELDELESEDEEL